MASFEKELLMTPLIVAEIDYLVSRVGGTVAARAFYEDLSSGANTVEWWPEAITETVAAAEEHRDIGLADASLITLAAQLKMTHIVTLDERRFRTVCPLTGEAAFTLLPTDA